MVQIYNNNTKILNNNYLQTKERGYKVLMIFFLQILSI
jgi:hypothetical protein